jgi:hypothetical protein
MADLFFVPYPASIAVQPSKAIGVALHRLWMAATAVVQPYSPSDRL